MTSIIGDNKTNELKSRRFQLKIAQSLMISPRSLRFRLAKMIYWGLNSELSPEVGKPFEIFFYDETFISLNIWQWFIDRPGYLGPDPVSYLRDAQDLRSRRNVFCRTTAYRLRRWRWTPAFGPSTSACCFATGSLVAESASRGKRWKHRVCSENE